MIIPVRCFTCNKVVGNKWKTFEKLRNENFKIASLVLDWRQFSKLKNTYCEGLISRENKNTNRYYDGLNFI